MLIVVGASRGLGRALALELATRADALVLSARSEKDLEETRSLIAATHPSARVYVEQLDLTDSGSLSNYVSRIVERGMALRGLVNTAAGFYKGPFTQQSEEDVENLISANYVGTVRLIHAILSRVKTCNPCDIINVTSLSAATTLDSTRSSSLHIATKAALHLFGVSVGREVVKEGIRVTSLAPGTLARKGRSGVKESTIVDCVKWLFELPNDAWIEEVVLRPTGFNS